ncbi:MAG: hypothetical protein K0R39_4201 [Symbiobacteriaceae bacterium]|nr:hypothetical protein [Symbiobacteriaceae bacterium]
MDDRLAELIERAGVARVKDRLAEHAARSIRLHLQPAAGRPVPGASRIGGLPDLPSGVEWPHSGQGATPLAFLAQVNLAETASYDEDGLLPKSGMLYFFVDAEEPYGFGPADRSRWQVIHSEAVPSAGPSDAPEDLPEESIYKAWAVTFEAQWTLPPYDSPMAEPLHLTTEETVAYFEATDVETIHRLLGHPQQIQGFVPYEVAMAEQGLFHSSLWDTDGGRAARAQYQDWVLLLQLDSDNATGMMWGDVGRLYFYICCWALWRFCCSYSP